MDRRRGSDLVWLWLWRRLEAVAPVGPLAWELPYAMGAALEKTKKNRTRSSFFFDLHVGIFCLIHSFTVLSLLAA